VSVATFSVDSISAKEIIIEIILRRIIREKGKGKRGSEERKGGKMSAQRLHPSLSRQD